MLPIQFEEEYTDQPDVATETDACDYFIMGTPGEFSEAIEQRVNAGVMKSQFWFADFPAMSGMELFADEILLVFH